MEQDKRCLAVFEAQSEGFDDAPSYLSLQLSQGFVERAREMQGIACAGRLTEARSDDFPGDACWGPESTMSKIGSVSIELTVYPEGRIAFVDIPSVEGASFGTSPIAIDDLVSAWEAATPGETIFLGGKELRETWDCFEGDEPGESPRG